MASFDMYVLNKLWLADGFDFQQHCDLHFSIFSTRCGLHQILGTIALTNMFYIQKYGEMCWRCSSAC